MVAGGATEEQLRHDFGSILWKPAGEGEHLASGSDAEHSIPSPTTPACPSPGGSVGSAPWCNRTQKLGLESLVEQSRYGRYRTCDTGHVVPYRPPPYSVYLYCYNCRPSNGCYCCCEHHLIMLPLPTTLPLPILPASAHLLRVPTTLLPACLQVQERHL